MASVRMGTYVARVKTIRAVIASALRGALAGAIVGLTVASVLVLIDSVVWKTFDIFSGDLPRDLVIIMALRLGGGALRGILVGSVVGAVVGGSDISNRLGGVMLRASMGVATALLVSYVLTKTASTLLSFTMSNFPDVIVSRRFLVQTFSIVVNVVAPVSAAIGLFVGIPSEYYAGRRRNVVKLVFAAVIIGVVLIIVSFTLVHRLFD